jgi:Cu+-exporting ATPase
MKYLRSNLKKEIYILSGDSKKTVADVGHFLDIPDQNLLGEMDAESKKNLLYSKKTKVNSVQNYLRALK